MKTLFLDFDGVLHPDGAAGLSTTDDGHSLLIESENLFVTGHRLFCWLPILNEIAADRNVWIAVHSSWRNQFSASRIVQIFPESLRSKVLGTTQGSDRYGSIIDLVSNNRLQDYLVLDDQPQWFPVDWSRLLICDPDLGLSEPRVIEQLKAFCAG